MASKKEVERKSVSAIKVRQWLPDWNKISFNDAALQSKPPEGFYLFSMKASELKALTGVYRRSTKLGTPRARDPNVQRGHEEARSATIRSYVKSGFPWCDMTEAQKKRPDSSDLLKPGWLPTSILVNILPKNASRNGTRILDKDLISVVDGKGVAELQLPKSFADSKWTPESIFPLEVIDGQHRLWAFEGFNPGEDYELPVVAFDGLDRSWQAYLFWSVNITPKKINRSLAFDLYPLLRQEDWLDKFSGHSIYREARCQELVESLWSYASSPWHKRINMLGESSHVRESPVPMVSQAAWIRSLMVSFVKQWEGSGTRVGGLYGAPMAQHQSVLPWNRPMQAAFLIYAGQQLEKHVTASKAEWAKHVRNQTRKTLFDSGDPAFFGPYSLLSTDQGIRGFLNIINDLCYIDLKRLKLDEWRAEDIYDLSSKKKPASATEDSAIDDALKILAKTEVASFIEEIAKNLASYDWRTSSTPEISEKDRLKQAVFRGSGGYKELRRQLLVHLRSIGGESGDAAKKAITALGFS
jgi:hypothetical protein